MGKFWNWFREQWTYAGIVNAHRAAGSPDPYFAANSEIFLRAEYLERFRDFASARYLAGHDLASSATAFIEKHLKAKTTVLDSSTTAMVRAVIRDMREDEAFHPEAAAKYRADFERALADINVQAKRMYGPKKTSPMVDRVLRG